MLFRSRPRRGCRPGVGPRTRACARSHRAISSPVTRPERRRVRGRTRWGIRPVRPGNPGQATRSCNAFEGILHARPREHGTILARCHARVHALTTTCSRPAPRDRRWHHHCDGQGTCDTRQRFTPGDATTSYSPCPSCDWHSSGLCLSRAKESEGTAHGWYGEFFEGPGIHGAIASALVVRVRAPGPMIDALTSSTWGRSRVSRVDRAARGR